MQIISPENFTHVPWKNGLGFTKELMISPGSNLDNFDWRLSIAKVSEDGVFSDFTGYTRDLILIEGNGLSLHHNEQDVDDLNNILDFAHFDGGSTTLSRLHDGAINDFNVMVRTKEYVSDVSTFEAAQDAHVYVQELAFIYGLNQELKVKEQRSSESITLPPQHLLAINTLTGGDIGNHHFKVSGTAFILIKIKRRTS